MPIDITARFSFDLPDASDVLLQFEAAAVAGQRIMASETRMSPADDLARVPAQAAIGERMWLRAHGRFEIDYSAGVAVERVRTTSPLNALEPHDLPGETIEYLFASRYCPAEEIQAFIAASSAAPPAARGSPRSATGSPATSATTRARPTPIPPRSTVSSSGAGCAATMPTC